jgi:Zn-dependent M28 family amino/carboxypeptidase
MRTTATCLLALALPALATANAGPGNGHDGPKPDHNKKPLVSSAKLQSLIKTKDLLAGSQKLQDFADANGGNRAFGGGGHNATVDYLYKTLKSLNYYHVAKQPFTEIYSSGTGSLSVDNGAAIAAEILTYTPGGEATAPLVAVANHGCDAADYPVAVAGNIALISRGTCPFSQKSVNAKAAGAVAAVIYNNAPGSLSGTLGTPFLEYAPVVGISQEDGTALLAKLAAGPVTGVFKVDAVVEERVSYNVIAETKEGDHDNVLVVGGHSDSVPAGPGVK